MIAAAEEAKLKCQIPELHFISNMLGCQLGRSDGKSVNTKGQKALSLNRALLGLAGGWKRKGRERLNSNAAYQLYRSII